MRWQEKLDVHRNVESGEISKPKKILRYQRRKVKILLMGMPIMGCVVHSFYHRCGLEHALEKENALWTLYWKVVTCMHEPNQEKVYRSIMMSLFMSSLLYMGPIY